MKVASKKREENMSWLSMKDDENFTLNTSYIKIVLELQYILAQNK